MKFEIQVGKRELHKGVWAAGRYFAEGRHVVDLPDSMRIGINDIPTLWLFEEQAPLGLIVLAHGDKVAAEVKAESPAPVAAPAPKPAQLRR
jgi:hypothetical protein